MQKHVNTKKIRTHIYALGFHQYIQLNLLYQINRISDKSKDH